jgi:K(+)-stimulated pyrophosphate-energized sodium pump
VLGAVSIVASIVGTYFVKARDGDKIMNALYRGIIVSGVIAAIAFYFVTKTMMGADAMNLFLCALIGLALTAAMIWITEYYISCFKVAVLTWTRTSCAWAPAPAAATSW